MNNRLVMWLDINGQRGKRNAVRRVDVAAALAISIRDVRELAEESRLMADPRFIVCFSTNAKNGGIYLADGADDISEMKAQVRRECLKRLRQYKALKLALAKINQRTLFPLPSGGA